MDRITPLVILTWANLPEHMILFVFYSVLPFFLGMWMVTAWKETIEVFAATDDDERDTA